MIEVECNGLVKLIENGGGIDGIKTEKKGW
jgi:hypothetical protein